MPVRAETARRPASSSDEPEFPVEEVTRAPTTSSTFTASEAEKLEDPVPSKTVKKCPSLVKTCSVTGAPNAPIISVSSVMDDTVEDPELSEDMEVSLPPEVYKEEEEEEEVTVMASSSRQLAPLAVPDCESPIGDPPKAGSSPEPETDGRSNDVCPWEDE